MCVCVCVVRVVLWFPLMLSVWVSWNVSYARDFVPPALSCLCACLVVSLFCVGSVFRQCSLACLYFCVSRAIRHNCLSLFPVSCFASTLFPHLSCFVVLVPCLMCVAHACFPVTCGFVVVALLILLTVSSLLRCSSSLLISYAVLMMLPAAALAVAMAMIVMAMAVINVPLLLCFCLSLCCSGLGSVWVSNSL
jgi:hypothetical protein